MFKQIVHFQIKYAKILFIMLLVIIGCAIYIAKDLKIDSSFSSLISSESEFNVNDRKIKTAFGTNDAVLILISKDKSSIVDNIPQSMKDDKVTIYIKELKGLLSQSQYVVNINGPVYSENDELIQLGVSLSRPDSTESLSNVKAELEYLLSEAPEPPGIKTQISGFPIIIDRVSTLLITDNLNTILITTVFIFLILFWFSKNFYFTLATIATPIVSLIFLAAFMVILKIDITITLAAVGVLILGLGADYGIHIAVHYLRAREKHEEHEVALFHTIETLRLPIFASFITTLAGFAALMLGVSPSSQNQGVVLALGIAIIFAVTFIQFPIIISIFANKLSFKETLAFKLILDLLGNFAVFITKYSKLMIWIVIVITIIMVFGAMKVEFSTSNSNWIPDEDPISESFREFNSAYGNTDSLTLIIESTSNDLRNVATALDVQLLKKRIEAISNVDSVITPYDNLGQDSDVIYDAITNDERLRSQFNDDFTLSTIRITSQNFGQDEAGNSIVLREIREIVDRYPIDNVKVSLYGNIVRFEELGESLQQDAGVTTIAGLGLVFLVASLTYASISVGFLSLLPIIIAVIWAVGLMGYFGVPFTSLSTGIISLVLGIGVDFSIHLVDGIKKYLGRGEKIKDAVYHTMTTSGKAIFLSSLTTFAGFMALVFATLLGTQRLGFSLAFAIISVFFVSIMLVPSVMALIEKRRLRKLQY